MALVFWNNYSYDTARADILARAAQGLGYDYDGYYGYQCWDLGANWYGMAGKAFQTKNSYTGAGGEDSSVFTTWTYQPAFENNSSYPFIAVTDINQIKRGDMIIWNKGRYSWDTTGHNAFADEDYVAGMTTIRVLGQNQQDASATQGHIPTLNNLTTNMILGAFRYIPWNGSGPGPGPDPGPVAPGGAVLKPSGSNIVILKTACQRRRKWL